MPTTLKNSKSEGTLHTRHYLMILFLTGCAIALHLSFDNWLSSIDHTGILFADFINIYYPTSTLFLKYNNHVPGFFYTPTFALATIPLALLPLNIATFLWGLFQFATIVIFFRVGCKQLENNTKTIKFLFYFVIITSFPIANNFKWGQLSLFMVTCLLFACYLYDHGKKWQALPFLAIPATVKVFSSIFILPFLLWKDFRFFLRLILAYLTLWLIIPFLLIGVEETWRFYFEVKTFVEKIFFIFSIDPNAQFFPYVISRYVYPATAESIPYRFLIVGVQLFVGTIALLTLFRLRETRKRALYSFLLLLSIQPFLIPSTWHHYFVFLSFGNVFLLSACNWSSFCKKEFLIATLCINSLILSSLFTFRMMNSWWFYASYGFTFLANFLFLLALLISIWFPKATPSE